MNNVDLFRYVAIFVSLNLVGILVYNSSIDFRRNSQLRKYDIFRSCQLNGPTNTTDAFAKHYKTCIIAHLPEFHFEFFHMGRFNEKKVFLPLVRNSSAADNCNFLTIGIGKDILVEKEFKQAYPECTVFGIEPSPDQVAGFNNFGTVIPFGVGVKNDTIELTLRKGAAYYKENVTVVALSTLLDTFVKTRLIHYATIDIEGAEFPILEALLPGKKLYNEGIVFCQIDAELHEFHSESQEVINLLKAFSSDVSPYVSVVTNPFLTHQKVTFINVVNNVCREAFNLNELGL